MAITENTLMVVTDLETTNRGSKVKYEELTLQMMSELIYDTSKQNIIFRENHVNKEFTKSLFNCFGFATHCITLDSK